MPHAHDQADNAYRATRLGVASTLPASRYRSDRAAAALRVLLEEESVARRAAGVGATVAAEDGIATACDAIEGLLGA